MKDTQNKETTYSLTEEDARKLLFGDNEIKDNRNKIFDEFGNYIYSTDVVTNIPNTAIGTANGLSLTVC